VLEHTQKSSKQKSSGEKQSKAKQSKEAIEAKRPSGSQAKLNIEW